MREFLNSISGLVLRLTLPVTVFVLPLLFLPLTHDIFQVKQLALVIIACLALVAFAVQSVIRQRIIFSLTPATVPVLFLALVYLISGLFQSSSRSLALHGEVTTIFALTVIFLATTFTLQSKNHIRLTLKAFFASLSLLSVSVILHALGAFSTLGEIPWLAAPGFNPAGGPLPFLYLSLPGLLTMLYLAFKVEKGQSKIFLFAASGLVTLASFISLGYLLPSQPLAYLALPLKAGWEIAVQVLSMTRTSLLGTGPESFASTFTQARPAWLNNTALWNLRFTLSTNTTLQLLTTLGVLGFGAWIFLLTRLGIAHHKSLSHKNPLSNSLRLLCLGLLLGWLLIPPVNILVVTFLFIVLNLLALDLKTSSSTRNYRLSMQAAEEVSGPVSEAWAQTPKQGPREVLSWILLALVLLSVSGSLLFKGRAYAAQMLFARSLAVAQTDGLAAYRLQAQAIALDPQSPILRVTGSQINFALAQTISNQPEPSDQDKNNISQLVQMSLNEARVATNLDPRDVGVWQNLGNIYRQLIGSAEGADQWTIAALTQAVGLDPTNPQMRLQLGEVYYTLGNYNEAINMFSQAAQLKNDLANAHYGLAVTFRQVKQYSQAVSAMKAVLALLQPDTEEYAKTSKELAELEVLAKNQPGADDAVPTNPQTNQPQPTPTPTLAPLEIPEQTDLNTSPTPTFPYPEATPTEQPQPTPYEPVPIYSTITPSPSPGSSN